MSRKARLLMAAIAIVVAQLSPAPGRGADERTSAARADQVGKTFLFDYGDLVFRVRYLSESKLRWQQLKGPSVGLEGTEDYGVSTVRPGVYFVWWQEKDTSIVTQVVDLEARRVHTTWTSPDKKLAAYQGTIVPQDSAPAARR